MQLMILTMKVRSHTFRIFYPILCDKNANIHVKKVLALHIEK